MSDLKDQVRHIVHQLEMDDTEWYDPENYGDDPDSEPSAHAYLEDALDIEYVISSTGQYLGARVLVTFGGPNIWINTRTCQVEGHWWGEKCDWGFADILGVNDYLGEMYECVRGQ